MQLKEFHKFDTFSAYIYVLEENNHVLIFDVGNYSEEFHNYLKGKIIDGIILTHKHFDHMMGIPKLLLNHHKVNIYAFDDGLPYLSDWNLNGSYMFGININFAFNVKPIKEGEFKIGNFKLNIVHTPGHTTDCITIFNDETKVIISGDFLFPNTIGRTDLVGSNNKLMKESLIKIQEYLKDDYLLCSGHAMPEYIKEVKRINPFLR